MPSYATQEDKAHYYAERGAQRWGEQAHNWSKSLQPHAKLPWAKSQCSQEATHQRWVHSGSAKVQSHRHRPHLAQNLVGWQIPPLLHRFHWYSADSMYLNDGLRLVCSFHMRIKHISKDPAPFTYERRLAPPHLNTTHKRKSNKEVEEQHHSNGLRP